MDIKERLKNLTPEQREMLIKRLSEKQNQSHLPEKNIIVKRTNEYNIPLSFTQSRFWFLQKLDPHSPVYNFSIAYRISGNLDIKILIQSVNKIIERHEILRTSFPVINGSPNQRIEKHLDVDVPVIDCADLNGESNIEVQKLMDAEASKPFSLNGKSFIKFRLFRAAKNEHYFQIITHHLVADGWSIRNLLKELVALYESFSNGSYLSLPSLPVQFADFSIWEQDNFTREKTEKQLNYWKTKLGDAPLVLDMPTDKPRPPIETFSGKTIQFQISKKLTEKIKQFSQKYKVTIYHTLLASFQTLLFRYSRQEDILVGTAVANINTSEIANLIGSFSNNIVLRASFSSNPTFVEFLEQVRNTTIEALQNQDLPFERLLEELHPERDLSRNPVFQYAFIFHHEAIDHNFNITGLKFEIIPVNINCSRFDLSLEMDYDDERLVGFFEFKDLLYEMDTIDTFKSHYINLLESVVKYPNELVSRLQFLTLKDEHKLLHTFNDTFVEYPKDKSLIDLVEEQVKLSGTKVAVQSGNKKISYNQLNEQANQLARYLIDNGVEPGDCVGVCIDRSIDMLVGMFAILKCGAAYVPMDPIFPINRLKFMIEDADVKVVLTTSHLTKIFNGFNGLMVLVDSDWEKIKIHDNRNLEIKVSQNLLAYVIFTSGSTGKPKGVQIEHRSLMNFLLSMQKQPGIKSNDVFISVTTISFDISVLELFLPLITGAELIIATQTIASDGKLLIKTLNDTRGTVMQATPSTWRLMIDAGWKSSPKLTMLCGGEAFSLDLAKQLLERGMSLWNMYGPTETTIWSSVKKIEPEDESIYIGTPIANTQFYILDKELNLVPIGVPGELMIGGDGLSSGYLKRPELSREKFIDNPFDKPGTKLYKTGDLARFKDNGEIEFLGRLDFQVKVRGFRIELGEIENILSEYPHIKDVVVNVWTDNTNDKKLVAYYIPTNGKNISISESRQFLKNKLPDYMIPSHFVKMEALPLTPNAKIDRQALPPPEISRTSLSEKYSPPRNELENQLTQIWQKILQVKTISIYDNFFDLGGHSLLVIQLFEQIEKQNNIELPLALIFECPTINELASKIIEIN